MHIIWNPFKVQLNAAIPAKTLFIKNIQKGRDFRDFSISCNAETAKKSPGVISFGGVFEFLPYVEKKTLTAEELKYPTFW